MSAASERSSVESTLTSAIQQLERESALKKTIRESTEPVEDIVRTSTAELNHLHSSPAAKHEAIATKALETIATAHPHWVAIAALIPKGEFYRYQFAVAPLLKSLVTNIALARFILHDELVPAFTAASLMGLQGEDIGELQLTSDEYLQGVIGMVNELPRLSVNSVTAQSFALPGRIASFVNDIFASYSMLNLRNDALRRKFDSLKYDLKRCEDVVYDLTLRGLGPATTA
ncbi:Translin [Vanrija pseudolonga]|uniref:Translin n=1 Tax=Vanrija pseudolonga TaxID=143232 RepID=A0AAF0XZT4_9TREE|nr:Translin [Vanrija pseudolonga]